MIDWFTIAKIWILFFKFLDKSNLISSISTKFNQKQHKFKIYSKNSQSNILSRLCK